MVNVSRQLAFNELLRAYPTEDNLAIDLSFPEDFANRLSQQEAFNKHLFRPNTYLHKWWARRCGSTFRTILKQFVADPEQRDYYAAGGLEGKVVLDPMMGGGTTLHEAIRLGANVIGVDVDPIPVVQTRASLTQLELKDLQAAFDRFFIDLYQRIGSYFQTECPECDQTLDSRYTLHGIRKKCTCREVVQIDQYELREEEDRIIRIWPDSWVIADNDPAPAASADKPKLITKADTTCDVCGQKYQDLLDVPFYARYVPVAIVGQCPQHGLFFRSPSELDVARVHAANELRAQLDFGAIEDFSVKDGPKSRDLLIRNVRSYLDVFSSRQLLYLYHSIQLLREYQGAIKLNLAILISTSLEFNAMLCGYKGWFKRRPGAIRHVFALHAYVFQYTVTENNPVNHDRSSGNLQLLFRDRIERGHKWAIAPIERKIDRQGNVKLVKIAGEIDVGNEVFNAADLKDQQQAFWLIHGDSTQLPLDDHSIDIIVTDPPYYDSVQYSDLAAFFRVWLARLLPEEESWAYDESRSAVASRSVSGESRYQTILGGIFKECARVLKNDTGRMVFTFHHWDPTAWAELTIALKQANFKLINAHVVFSENPISSHINNLKALKHDAILALALEGEHVAREWLPISSITASDSETFCRQCGAALGWLLSSNFSAHGILATWKQLIQGRS
jgi:putative DNA methylase